MTFQTESATAHNLVKALETARNDLRDAEQVISDAAPQLEAYARLTRTVGRAKQTAYFAQIRADKARVALRAMRDETTHDKLKEAINAVLDME